MQKVCSMAQHALEEANAAMKTVQRNREQARHVCDFMQAHMLMAQYQQWKVAAGTEALVYAWGQRSADKTEAEKLADEALGAYLAVTDFLAENLAVYLKDQHGVELTQDGLDLEGLVSEEKKERENLAQIFDWPRT